ncbi:DUF885 domain-containing protein [Actinocatenispora comari]|uniref:DUF885 domain-containing protein n=1 Tax=Actinocatenispora comari TaxID=2807577 RepID=A0A8J4EIH0_9ACTN|nr:DUF885 domain-containing protein [Actinocatenispora comari]GIL26077.1 hypothetical protein NUM_13310 [Actinocatenispora comari]
MSIDFPTLAERIVTAMLDPLTAHYAGAHVADDELMDFSPSAVADQTATLRDASHALSEVDGEELEAEEQVDHAMLSAVVDARLFALTEIAEHEWNPLLHNPGPLLDVLISREFAPPEERLAHLVNRLAALPDALATARAVLTDCPQLHVRTAIDQFAGVADLVRGRVDELAAAVPSARDRVETARSGALAALAEFDAWLRARADVPGRSPRLGRRHWEAKLWHTLDTPLTAAELDRRAWSNLSQSADQLREVAARIVGGKPTDDAVRQALAAAADRRPDPADIVAQARADFVEATSFVEQFELVTTLPDEPCRIAEMPEYERGVAAAYCDAPGPMERPGLPTLLAISPPPADWSAERITSFYREYNDDMLRNLIVHEGMPGHYLQLAHARRFGGATPVRAVFTSGTFVEGWAVYAERLLAEHGFGGPQVRLQQLKMQLRSTLNTILDQAVHCDGLAESEAIGLLTTHGFQEEGEAVGKWRRALLTSTQLSTYFVGYTEMSDIAAARPADTDLRGWHDEMLAHGSPSPRHLRDLLTRGVPN